MRSDDEQLASLLSPTPLTVAGGDSQDSTASGRPVEDFAAGLLPAELLQGGSKPLAGRRIGLVMETLGEGVAQEIEAVVRGAARHLEALGAVVEEVRRRRGTKGFVGIMRRTRV